uniref:Uncharacterized protein n=1 Tax=Arundo donax TaxID=35708 RepID=A0A0A9STS9_ARUDO
MNQMGPESIRMMNLFVSPWKFMAVTCKSVQWKRLTCAPSLKRANLHLIETIHKMLDLFHQEYYFKSFSIKY